MSIIRNLKNIFGTPVFPVTAEKAVYDENGNRLDNKISSIESDIGILRNLFDYTFHVCTIKSTDDLYDLPTISGYRPVSVNVTGGDYLMPNISYCFRQSTNNSKVEIQCPSDYVNKIALIYILYVKDSFF